MAGYNYYDTSGGADILQTTFPTVHQYDASSFYNWEQDNLPLQDLKERTHRLELLRGGYADDLSAVTLTVSSSVSTAMASAGFYPTAQDAVNAVPKVLNFPVLIQLADYGNLGSLDIAGIVCQGEGLLQIENINSAKDLSAAAASVTSQTGLGPSAVSSYSYVSAIDLISSVSSVTSQRNSVATWNATSWKNNARVFSQTVPDSQNEANNLDITVFDGTMGDFSGASNTVKATGYDNTFDVTVSADPNPKTLDGSGTSLLQAVRRAPTTTEKVSMLAYGSYFSNISISNCNKIKLKNKLASKPNSSI